MAMPQLLKHLKQPPSIGLIRQPKYAHMGKSPMTPNIA
jgi:hypothetical protein